MATPPDSLWLMDVVSEVVAFATLAHLLQIVLMSNLTSEMRLSIRPVTVSVFPPHPEWIQRKEGGAAVPVHRLARPWRAGIPHPVPGLPAESEDMQPP